MRVHPRLLIGTVALAGACAAPPPALPPPAPPPPRPAPVAASWTPFDAPPLARAARATARAGDRELRLDASDTRWLLRPGAAPVRSASFEAAPLDGVMLLEHGAVALSRDGRALYAPDDTGPWQPFADLPPGGETLGGAVYRGGITVRTRGGAGFVRAPEGPAAARGVVEWLLFEGRRAIDARIGADCKGIAVFSPQRIARTADCGHTFEPLDDRGVLAASLRTDGDRIILTPGGERDLFARAFAPGASRLERALDPGSGRQPESSMRQVDVHDFPSDAEIRRAIEEKTPIRTSVPSWISPSAGREALSDGDQVFLFSQSTLFGAGRLGGAFAWLDRAARFPGCESGPVAFTACGGTRVFACAGYLRAWTEGPTPKAFDPIVGVPDLVGVTDVALQTSHDLFYAKDHDVWRVDLLDPTRPVHVSRAAVSPVVRLRTRCDEAHPGPVWIGVAKVLPAGQAWNTSDEDVTVPVAFPSTKTRAQVVLGLTPDGGLIVRDSETRKLAVLHDDGSIEERRGSGPKDPDVAMAFNAHGRGLWIERSTGNAFQSIDAGATWTPVRGPGRPIGDAGLFCTQSACEVEGLFVRHGWDEPAAEPALPSPPEAPSGRPDKPAQIACEAVPGRVVLPVLPAEVSSDGVVPFFGPAGALWAATQVTWGKETETETDGFGGPMTQRSVWMLTGTAEGKVTKTLAGSWKGTRPSTASMVLAREGALFLWMDGKGLESNVVSANRRALAAFSPGDGTAPPRPLRGAFGDVAYMQGTFAVSTSPFVTASGVAVLNMHDRKVLWIDRKGALSTRPWPDHPLAGDDEVSRVALAARSDGTWLGVETSPGSVRLIAVSPDGVTRTRTLALAPEVEQGPGILAAGDDVDVALVEHDETGTPAIRLHRVDADLGLGPPRTVAGTRGSGAAPLPLPACAGAPPAGFMDLQRKVMVRFGNGTNEADLVRRVRFHARGACVERSMLDESTWSGLRVVTQGGIDGAGVLAVEGSPAGARCKALP